MIEIFFLAIALSMDAFAVSLTLGTQNLKHIKRAALFIGLFFGIFHLVMPLLGYLGGVALLGWLEVYASVIAFVLLLGIGLNMVYHAISNHDSATTAQTINGKENVQQASLSQQHSHSSLLLLALATSIDALAVGFTLPIMSVSGFYVCIIIGVVCFGFTYTGVKIGKKYAKYLGNKAELVGGLLLIALGVKVLFF